MNVAVFAFCALILSLFSMFAEISEEFRQEKIHAIPIPIPIRFDGTLEFILVFVLMVQLRNVFSETSAIYRVYESAHTTCS